MVTSFTTQYILSNKAFYVLQSPSGGLFWGSLVESKACGRFVSFDQGEVVGLGESVQIQDISFLKAYKAEFLADFVPYGKNIYEKRFKAFKSDKSVEKAVLFETYVAESFLALEGYLSALNSLLNAQKRIGGYIYGFYDPGKKRAFLGLSPEYLYKTDENKGFWTTAVAGSQRALEPWSEKLILEHKMVEQGIKESLSEEVTFSEAETLEYGDMVHLSSKAKILTNVELSKKLHPTAAVGTLPKDAYKRLDLGPKPRGFYGGYAELDAAFSLVTIRGLEWRGGKLLASIGGGVLKESSLEEEWSELSFKWEQFKKLWSI